MKATSRRTRARLDGRQRRADDDAGCATTFQPARSRSSSPMSRGRRGCSTSSAPTPTPRLWPNTAERSGRPALLTAASRWTPRATRSSSPSQQLRAPLAASSAMTEALAPGLIRVRVGLHTGTPLLAVEGYIGDDVHRAARIAGFRSRRPGARLRLDREPRGARRSRPRRAPLQGPLGAPERVYQLGVVAFPALKSLYRTNLPVATTTFLGRERELGEIAGLLRQADLRLVTLTGPGGTGKTRLAVQGAAEAAESFSDGLWWVPAGLAHRRTARAPVRRPGARRSRTSPAANSRRAWRLVS